MAALEQITRMPAAIVAELTDVFRVAPAMKFKFWIAYFTVCLSGLAGLLPLGILSLVMQLGGIIFVSATAIRASWSAWQIRRLGWVAYPHGPLALASLETFLILLAFPVFLVSLTVLYWRIESLWPNTLPTTETYGASSVALHNLLHCELFFDVVEIFHLPTIPRAHDTLAQTVIFVTRLLLSITFIKLAWRIISHASLRVRGLGRGEDRLTKLPAALKAGDIAAVRALSMGVGQTVRDTLDILLARVKLEDDEEGPAWSALVALRSTATPYFETLMLTSAGEDQQTLKQIIVKLNHYSASSVGFQQLDRVIRHRQVAWLAITFTVVALPFYFTGVLALLAAMVALILFSWSIVDSRGWLDRLVAWRCLAAVPPQSLPYRQLAWTLCYSILLAIVATRLFTVAPNLLPNVFESQIGSSEPITSIDALSFVLANFIRTNLFVDFVEVYGIRVQPLVQAILIGCLLTFVLRLSWDLGIISSLVAVRNIWLGRLTKGVQPNIELLLQEEAERSGVLSPRQIAYYHRQIVTFIATLIQAYRSNPELIAQLAYTGMFSESQSDYKSSSWDGTPTWHQQVGLELLTLNFWALAENELTMAIERDQRATNVDNRSLAKGYRLLGVTLHRHGRLHESEQQLRLGVQVAQKISSTNSTSRTIALAKCRGALGDLYRQLGKLDMAEIELTASLRHYQELIAEDHQGYFWQLAESHSSLGLNYHSKYKASVESLPLSGGTSSVVFQTDEDELLLHNASKHFEQAAEIFNSIAASDQELGISFAGLKSHHARVLADLGDWGRAEEAYSQASHILTALIRHGDLWVEEALISLQAELVEFRLQRMRNQK